MSTTRLLKSLLAPAWLGVCLVVPPSVAAADPNPLVAERWKTRPVVVVVPTQGDALLARVKEALGRTATREAFIEREMVLYTVVAGRGARNDKPLDVPQAQALLRALGLNPAGPPTFVLIGKDGGAKMTEGADVDLQAVFAEIDRMPMRQPR